jgi:hypothetical protein
MDVSSNPVTNSISDQSLILDSGDVPYTHYSVYAVKNLREKINNSEFYTWLGDFPVAKAFRVEVTDANNFKGRLTASHGVFTKYDIGSTVRIPGINVFDMVITNIEEGSSGESIAYVTNMPFYHPDPYYLAVIGGGKVMEVSQSGNMLTITDGDSVLAEHMNMMVFWHDGTISYSSTLFDSANFTILDTIHDGQTGYVTLAPTGRNFNDTVSDVELGYREKSFPLQNRFWSPLPNGPVGVIVPGFMFVSPSSETLYYCSIGLGTEYLTGHYRTEYQYHEFRDVIRGLLEFPNTLIVFCSRSTYRVQTGTSDFVETPEVGESIAVITGAGLISDAIGIGNMKNMLKLDQASVIVFTSNNELRLLSGSQFSDNMATDAEGRSIIAGEFSKLQPEVSMTYDQLMGVILWGSVL